MRVCVCGSCFAEPNKANEKWKERRAKHLCCAEHVYSSLYYYSWHKLLTQTVSVMQPSKPTRIYVTQSICAGNLIVSERTRTKKPSKTETTKKEKKMEKKRAKRIGSFGEWCVQSTYRFSRTRQFSSKWKRWCDARTDNIALSSSMMTETRLSYSIVFRSVVCRTCWSVFYCCAVRDSRKPTDSRPLGTISSGWVENEIMRDHSMRQA